MSLILYVEDDNVRNFWWVEYWEGRGHETILANDGQAGWERLNQMEKEGRLPDLILSGVIMPFASGVELCNRVRAEALFEDPLGL